MRMTVLCNVTLRSLVDKYQQFGSRLLKNVGTYLSNYMASLPRKESSSCPLNLISQRENEDS